MADVTIEEQVAAAVETTTGATGRIDGLFACAGGSLHLGSILDADIASVRATVDLNLMGSVICVKHAGAAFAAQRRPGSIVLMSSGAGRFPHPHLWAYGVAKAGICFLCETAAEELGPLGIRVNAVARASSMTSSCRSSRPADRCSTITWGKCLSAGWARSRTWPVPCAISSAPSPPS